MQIQSHAHTHKHAHTHHSDLCDAGASESHYDGHNVDSKLELKKLGDAVVDVAAPHYCLDDAAEVVISQNDIRRLLGHICTSNTLKECREGAVRKKLGKTVHNYGDSKCAHHKSVLMMGNDDAA